MELAPGSVSALCGLAAGVTLGVAGRAGRFCTLGMLEDAYYGSDLRRLRAFGLAAAVAVAGTQAMAAFGVIDLNRSIYLGDHFGIGGAILGGILFGVGMGLVGTCGFGTLVRIGSGDLRAIVDRATNGERLDEPDLVRLFAARLQRGGGAAAAATARPPVRRLLAPASLPNQSLHSHCRCPPSLTLN